MRLNESNIVLTIPYYKTGKSILIHESSGKKILSIDVSEYSSFCGNGKCNENEDYFLCPSECSSGAEDKYCDEVKDGICDPDCEENQDADCQVGFAPNYWIYLLVAVVIIVVLILALYRKFR